MVRGTWRARINNQISNNGPERTFEPIAVSDRNEPIPLDAPFPKNVRNSKHVQKRNTNSCNSGEGLGQAINQ